MAKTMTPSDKTTTQAQIDKAVGNYRALLEKHASDFPAATVQTVLGMAELAREMFDLLRKRVETLANMITRTVKVDRLRAPQQALEAVGFRQYVDENVVAAMPNGEGEETTVHFFKPRPEAYDKNGLLTDDKLKAEYELVGLKPADPYSLAAVSESDSAFVDERPNATHWQDADGKWCFAAFGRWGDERSVRVRSDDGDWGGNWWFAGVRK